MKDAFERLKNAAQEKAELVEKKIVEQIEELAGYAREEMSYSRAICLANLAILNDKLERHETASEYFIKSIEVLEALPRDERVLAKLIEITKRATSPLLAHKEEELARKYENKHYLYRLEALGDGEPCEEHVTVYGGLADNYLDAGELELALDYYKRRLAAREAVYADGFGMSCIAEDYTVIGLVYRRMGNFREAVRWQKESYKRHLQLHKESYSYRGKSGEFDWALYDCCSHLIDTLEAAGKGLSAHYYRCRLRAMEKRKPKTEEEEG